MRAVLNPGLSGPARIVSLLGDPRGAIGVRAAPRLSPSRGLPALSGAYGGFVAAALYGKNIPTAPPRIRRIDERSLSYGLGGPEAPYPVYEFSHGRCRLEYPGHNPFLHVPPYY